ncbi:hypothetical protein Acr_25g0008060 [Actinidia rufa]|uniref:Uncharacterized protein n=1 Tax=Actinidia rufa TaxID=165716 RepID=A0A7J0GZX8_9ERIC|nr:hypothetical protein Acr_25g0008060 [Actinidia rufa]
MAFRRSLSTRATFLARQRFSPSFSHINRDDDHKRREDREINAFLQHRSFGSGINALVGFGTSFQDQRCSQFSASRLFFRRNMSAAVGEGVEKIEYMSDVAEVIADRTVDAVVSAAPAVSEIVVAAADSAFPVAALQYLIDNVHSFTGFNW